MKITEIEAALSEFAGAPAWNAGVAEWRRWLLNSNHELNALQVEYVLSLADAAALLSALDLSELQPTATDAVRHYLQSLLPSALWHVVDVQAAEQALRVVELRLLDEKPLYVVAGVRS